APERFTKNLWSDRPSAERPRLVNDTDDAGQAGYVVETVLANRETGIRLKSQAILFRASHHSATLEIELTRCNIPFVKFGGLKFLEAAHIKDVLAILRWAQNMRDRVAGFRTVQLLPGIGPSSAAKLLDAVTAGADPIEALEAYRPPAAAVEHWPDFITTIRLLHLNAHGWPPQPGLVCPWYAPPMGRGARSAAPRLNQRRT